jgi:hypothetical protein
MSCKKQTAGSFSPCHLFVCRRSLIGRMAVAVSERYFLHTLAAMRGSGQSLSEQDEMLNGEICFLPLSEQIKITSDIF